MCIRDRRKTLLVKLWKTFFLAIGAPGINDQSPPPHVFHSMPRLSAGHENRLKFDMWDIQSRLKTLEEQYKITFHAPHLSGPENMLLNHGCVTQQWSCNDLESFIVLFEGGQYLAAINLGQKGYTRGQLNKQLMGLYASITH